ncbi:MAG: NAD(P)H-dependent flavin oxidoreductase [Micromonosporaceae bacterium]
MRTWLCDRFGLSVPVVGAPMAGVASGALAAAISRAGALGMIGVGNSTPAEWIAGQGEVARGGGPFGIGLMAWALEDNPAQLDAVVALRPALVSVSFGPYPRYLGALKDAGITVATQVGNLAEAQAAEQAGVDLIVARGGEGGGHGRNEVGTLVLLQTVLDHVTTPVLAAGGIASARGLAAVLAAGAQGAWVGTAFLCCTEADSGPGARERLLAACETDTAYGRVFDVGHGLGWPAEFGGRALRNSFFDRWSGREQELSADENARRELAAARARGDFDTAYIYAGQGVGLLRGERPAAEVVAEFARADDLLRQAVNGR